MSLSGIKRADETKDSLFEEYICILFICFIWCFLFCFVFIVALLSTLAFIGANRSVKELTSFEISFQQMVKPLFSAPLFSKVVHKNNACA